MPWRDARVDIVEVREKIPISGGHDVRLL